MGHYWIKPEQTRGSVYIYQAYETVSVWSMCCGEMVEVRRSGYGCTECGKLLPIQPRTSGVTSFDVPYQLSFKGGRESIPKWISCWTHIPEAELKMDITDTEEVEF